MNTITHSSAKADDDEGVNNNNNIFHLYHTIKAENETSVQFPGQEQCTRLLRDGAAASGGCPHPSPSPSEELSPRAPQCRHRPRPAQHRGASPHGEPAGISAAVPGHPGCSRAPTSSADATRGHRVI